MDGTPIEALLDLSNPRWNELIVTHIHEFTHTIEIGLDVYEYHKALFYDTNALRVPEELAITKLYLLNIRPTDNGNVGIPYSFWKGDIDVPISYIATTGGKINKKSSLTLYVPYGEDGEEVTATAEQGYRFVSWSDGITTQTRKETNVISTLNLRAIFEEDGTPKEEKILTFTITSKDTCEVRLYDKNVTSVTIPSTAEVEGDEYTVTSIAVNGFSSAKNLEEVILPETITKIGNSAFQNCTALPSITLPSSLTTIGTNAFMLCTALDELTIPASVQEIGNMILRRATAKIYLAITEQEAATRSFAPTWNWSESDGSVINETHYAAKP